MKITPRDIDSVFGLCAILSKKREGATFVVHVECKGPGGSQMLSDVTFTPREDKTNDFSDQDQTCKAVFHRCPDSGAGAPVLLQSLDPWPAHNGNCPGCLQEGARDDIACAHYRVGCGVDQRSAIRSLRT